MVVDFDVVQWKLFRNLMKKIHEYLNTILENRQPFFQEECFKPSWLNSCRFLNRSVDVIPESPLWDSGITIPYYGKSTTTLPGGLLDTSWVISCRFFGISSAIIPESHDWDSEITSHYFRISPTNRPWGASNSSWMTSWWYFNQFLLTIDKN